jgi:hypothetical protein
MEEEEISGMTINERLYHFGLFEQFDHAVMSRDHATIVGILRIAKFDENQALETANKVLANPVKYGY